jgi:nitrite reductase/ring-hydroxylating ferredoxin subunit
MLVEVGDVSEFTEGEFRVLTVGALEVGIARWKGTLYAIRNRCPDQGGPVCQAVVRPLVTYSVEEHRMLTNKAIPTVMCPWHFWRFDLRTGKALQADGRLRTYRVFEREGKVVVDIVDVRTLPCELESLTHDREVDLLGKIRGGRDDL